jgi:hypothetical protein
MNVAAVVVAVVVIVVIAAVLIWYFTRQQRRRAELRDQFGPEYEHAVETYGERGRAEQALTERSERVAALHIHPLAANESARFGEAWRQVQTEFVDDPEGAIRRADSLCGEVMQARGYPMGDFEQRAADISVDHAGVVQHYRAAHALAQKAERGDATTEDLRQAMVHYRTLFEELIETRQPAHAERS